MKIDAYAYDLLVHKSLNLNVCIFKSNIGSFIVLESFSNCVSHGFSCNAAGKVAAVTHRRVLLLFFVIERRLEVA